MLAHLVIWVQANAASPAACHFAAVVRECWPLTAAASGSTESKAYYGAKQHGHTQAAPAIISASQVAPLDPSPQAKHFTAQ